MQSSSAGRRSARDSADRLMADSREIARALERLDAEVASTFALWSDAGQDTYRSAQRNWVAATTRMEDLVARIARSTHEMTGAPASGGRAVADYFGR